MLKNSSTYNAQSELARYCRNGAPHSLQGVKKENLPHYRRLIRNIFDDTLTTAYPITKNLLSGQEWKNLIDDFMREFSPSAPQVWQMPKELWEFVVENRHPLTEKYHFLTELLWFEWLEIELFMMKDKEVSYKPEGQIKHDKLIINPEHRIEHFEWPVFLKSPNKISINDKGHYFLILFRHPDNGSVRFISLSPLLTLLIEIIGERPATLEDIIANLSIEIRKSISQDQENQIEEFLIGLMDKKLLLGFYKSTKTPE